MTSCDYTLQPCHNECIKDEKNIQLLRKDLEKHVKQKCPRRQYECPHCKEPGEYQERTTTHLTVCPSVEVPCPNRGCRETMQCFKITLHRTECLFELLPCKYTNIGCMEKLVRKQIEAHENDTQQHLQLAIDTVNKLGGLLVQLQSRLPAQESNT